MKFVLSKCKFDAFFFVMMSLLLCSSCYTKSVRIQDSKISSALMKWAYSIEKLNYQLYTKTVKYPESKDAFNEEYRDYYYSGITVVSIENAQPLVIDDEKYLCVIAKVGAQRIMRDASLPEGQMHGTVELIRPESDDELDWKIHGKTLMRN